MDRVSFGARIRSLRGEARLTQEQLGKRLRVTGQSIAHWESGRSLPAAIEVPSLAEALGVSVCHFYGVEEPPPKHPPAGLAEEFNQLDLSKLQTLLKDIVAFSNSGGGTIVFGLEPQPNLQFSRQVLQMWPMMAEEVRQEWRALADAIREEEP